MIRAAVQAVLDPVLLRLADALDAARHRRALRRFHKAMTDQGATPVQPGPDPLLERFDRAVMARNTAGSYSPSGRTASVCTGNGVADD